MLGWDYEAAVLLLFTKLEFVIKIFCFTKQRGNFKTSAENSLKKCIQSSNFHAHLDCSSSSFSSYDSFNEVILPKSPFYPAKCGTNLNIYIQSCV